MRGAGCCWSHRAAHDEEEVGASGGVPPSILFPLTPAPPPGSCANPWPCSHQTVAESIGGADAQGASAVGLTGTIPVEFSHGNDTIKTMAFVGQELSAVRAARCWPPLVPSRAYATGHTPEQVAAQSGQYIKYQCKKGQCGTCEVRVDGKWIRTCVSQALHRACHRAFQRACRAPHHASKVRLAGTLLSLVPAAVVAAWLHPFGASPPLPRCAGALCREGRHVQGAG